MPMGVCWLLESGGDAKGFKINSVVEPQLIAGHQNYKHSINAKAHRSKLSSLQIEERTR